MTANIATVAKICPRELAAWCSADAEPSYDLVAAAWSRPRHIAAPSTLLAEAMGSESVELASGARTRV
jgi:hypothetical protein